MSQIAFDPYAVLGVPRGADATEVRKAYRRLARSNHPDLTGDGATTERMQRINRAWEILSDPAEKARHDAGSVSHAPNRGHWAGAPRRNAGWAPPPRTWSTDTGTARGYAPPPSPAYYDDEDGPGWKTILGVLLIVLILAPILLAGLGGPAFGLLLLVFGRLAIRRFA